MAIKLKDMGANPILIPAFNAAAIAPWLPAIQRPSDREDLSDALRRIVEEGVRRYVGTKITDGSRAVESFIRNTVDAYELRGRWVVREGRFVPIADSYASLLPLVFALEDDVLYVGPPGLTADTRD
jgi:hypothetical protein